MCYLCSALFISVHSVVSVDALLDFVTQISLAWSKKEKKMRVVMFLHVLGKLCCFFACCVCNL